MNEIHIRPNFYNYIKSNNCIHGFWLKYGKSLETYDNFEDLVYEGDDVSILFVPIKSEEIHYNTYALNIPITGDEKSKYTCFYLFYKTFPSGPFILGFYGLLEELIIESYTVNIILLDFNQIGSNSKVLLDNSIPLYTHDHKTSDIADYKLYYDLLKPNSHELSTKAVIIDANSIIEYIRINFKTRNNNLVPNNSYKLNSLVFDESGKVLKVTSNNIIIEDALSPTSTIEIFDKLNNRVANLSSPTFISDNIDKYDANDIYYL